MTKRLRKAIDDALAGKLGPRGILLATELRKRMPAERPPISTKVTFKWGKKTLTGIVRSYEQCADDCCEVLCSDDGELYVMYNRNLHVLK